MFYKKINRDKKGVIGIIVFFVILFSILVIGFIGAIVVGVLDFTSAEITPILNDLGGDVSGGNVSQASQVTIGVVNGFVQAMPWLLVFAYVMALIFSIVFIGMYKTTSHPVFVGLYVVLMLLLIFGAIIMSNVYEDIYSGTDELATQLQANTGMSYLILYSPFIFAVIGAIAGIYAFASPREENNI